jgi:hypothetical protein
MKRLRNVPTAREALELKRISIDTLMTFTERQACTIVLLKDATTRWLQGGENTFHGKII